MAARFLIVALIVVVAGALPARAAPKSELWPRWLAHDPASTLSVDVGPWNRFLERYVVPGADGVNRLPYGRVSGQDRKALERYIATLAATPVSRLSRAEQLPFWVNLYNALTVKVILDYYPVQSILKIAISPGLFSVGPWGKKLVTIEGQPLSLDDIEHRILRPIWKDPRIHYVVNCASIGCPNLAAKAYTAATMDARMTAAARDYINNARGATVKDGRLTVSSLYKWYTDDFGGDDAGVIAHLKRYAGAELKARLERVKRIDADVYDWALNEAR